MYSEIILCLRNNADEVLEKQVNMLKERHNAQVLQMAAEEAAAYLKTCSSDALLISDDQDILLMAKEAGLATNSPEAMRDSYKKAMEMLKAMGLNF